MITIMIPSWVVWLFVGITVIGSIQQVRLIRLMREGNQLQREINELAKKDGD